MYLRHILVMIFFPTIQNYKISAKLLENYLWCFSNFGPVKIVFIIEEPSNYFKKFFKSVIGEEIKKFVTGELRWSDRGGVGVFASEKGQYFSELANTIVENTEAEHYLLVEPYTLVFPSFLALFDLIRNEYNYNMVYGASKPYNTEEFKNLDYEDFNFRLFLKMKDSGNLHSFVSKHRNRAVLSNNNSVLMAKKSVLNKTSFRKGQNNLFLYENLFDSNIDFGVYFIRDMHTLKLTIGEL